jgi:integrase
VPKYEYEQWELWRGAEVSPAVAFRLSQQLERAKRAAEAEAKPETRTIGQAVEQFLLTYRTLVEACKKSAGYYAILLRCVNDFADFIGRKLGCDRGITGQTWEAYCTHLTQRLAKKSPAYVAKYLRSAKTFINWAIEVELLKNPPRNLNSRRLAISVPAKDIEVFTVEEVRQLLDNASERTRLYILLALNCGMTQTDVSKLHPSEVDLTAGTITRKRSKTKDR